MVLLIHVWHHPWLLLLSSHIHSTKLIHLTLVHLLLLSHTSHHTRVLAHLLVLHEIIATHEAWILLVHSHAWLLHSLIRWHKSSHVRLESLCAVVVIRSSLKALITLHWIKALVLLGLELLRMSLSKSRTKV